MKRSLVFFGAFAGLASAQSVDLNRAWDSCPSEKVAFDRAAQGTGYTWHANRDYTAKELGQPVTAERLQRKLDEARSNLRTDTGDYGQASWRLAICGLTAALRQVQGGSTQSASSAPPSNRNTGRDVPEMNASRCLHLSDSQLRNNCNQRLVVNWCTDDYGTHACGNGNLGWAELWPGDSTYFSAGKGYWFACVAPARPSEVEYLPGRGLRAACTQ